MLTTEQKNNNEIRFIELLTKLNIDLTELNKFLDQIDFFNAPASTQYMGAYPGGLCEHALAVAHELGVLCNAYYPGRSSEIDVIIVALFITILASVMVYGVLFKTFVIGLISGFVVAFISMEGFDSLKNIWTRFTSKPTIEENLTEEEPMEDNTEIGGEE